MIERPRSGLRRLIGPNTEIAGVAMDDGPGFRLHRMRGECGAGASESQSRDDDSQD